MLLPAIPACTTSIYPGPRRPDSETMVVETSGMTVVSIDNVDPPAGSRFRLLPGAHHIEVALDDWNTCHGGICSSVLTLPACFTGRPGHTYLVRPQYYLGQRWRAQVIDENVTYAIASDDCSPPAANGEADPRTARYKRTDVAVPLLLHVPVN